MVAICWGSVTQIIMVGCDLTCNFQFRGERSHTHRLCSLLLQSLLTSFVVIPAVHFRYLWHCVQGQRQRVWWDRGPEGGAFGWRWRGCAQRCPQGDLSPQGAQAQEHCSSGRCAAQKLETDDGIWVLWSGKSYCSLPCVALYIKQDVKISAQFSSIL